MKIIITKEKDDPIALRASIGGNETAGYYLVYRGDFEAVIIMIARMLKEAKTLYAEGKESKE